MILQLFKLLKTLRVSLRKGEILSFFGSRYLLISDKMLFAFQRGLEKIVGRNAVKILLYNVGFEAGIEYAHLMRKVTKARDPKKLAKHCQDFARIAGWGIHKIEVKEKERLVIIKVFNPPLSRIAKKIKRNEPCCYLHLGLLAGTVAKAFNREVEGKEVKCVCKGDDYCEFHIKILKKRLKTKPSVK